jgi:hypothetical protein
MIKSFAISKMAATAAVFVLGFAATGTANAGPVPLTGFYVVSAASGTPAPNTNSATIFIPPNTGIRAHVQVTQVTSAASDWAVSVYISAYVQNGTIHSGQFFELQGENITEIKFTASVVDASVVGTLLLEYF